MDRALQAAQDTVRLPLYDVEAFRTDQTGLDQHLINCFAEISRNPTTGEGEVSITKRSGIQSVAALGFESHFTATAGTQFPIANYAIPSLYDVYVSAWQDGTNIRIIQYRPQAQSTTLIGTIASTTASGGNYVHFSHGWTGDRGGTTNTVLTVNYSDVSGVSNKAYTATASGGVFTGASLAQITAAGSPWGGSVLTKGPIIQLNNQWYVAAIDGRIFSTGTQNPARSYVSQADTIAGTQGWSDFNNFTYSDFPEQYEGLIAYKHHIVAFGKTSIQFFTDEGMSINPGTPIRATDQALIRFGAISVNHMINVDDILYWVAYGKDNTVGVWKLDGYTPVKISPKTIDNSIREILNYGSAIVNKLNIFTIVIGNKKHIGISGASKWTIAAFQDAISTPTPSPTQPIVDADIIGTSNYQMYNLEDRTWWGLSFLPPHNVLYPVTSFGNPIATSYDINPYRQYILISVADVNFVTENTSKLYSVGENSYLDFNPTTYNNDVQVWCSVQLNPYSFQNEKRKRINKAKVICTQNYYYSPAETDINYIYLHWTKNNATDFNKAAPYGVQQRTIRIPNSYFRYYVNNLGMGRQFNFCITERSSKAASFRCLELDLAQGNA